MSDVKKIEPIHPYRSPEALELLDSLYSMKGQGILTGQHDFLENPDQYVEYTKRVTGKYPAVHGYELGGILGQNAETIQKQRESIVQDAIAWNATGGIVTMMYHAAYPGASLEWKNVQRQTTQQEFNRVVTPGTEEYKSLIADLDNVAIYLKKLQAANVPVLWRPYHEMNGGWFWWGKKSDYTKLWSIMYERYVSVYGLDNLVWVWNPNAPKPECDAYPAYYPRFDMVDVLAVDIYDNDYKQSYHDELDALADGKPIAIGENGQMPGTDVLEGNQNKYVWFMTWGEMIHTKNTEEQLRKIMNSNRVLDRDDAAELRRKHPK
ncbi:glycosyl hydrolase [Paenibacillus sp. Soil522]|uniref:glycosyl hydrolase n=1 Tax=Paenibacillus sp. Soil522 TaxID=1736388 RepID=UPI00138F5651|nr:glycosyl hydrolase [Paenibacillus sp. Soil522]